METRRSNTAEAPGALARSSNVIASSILESVFGQESQEQDISIGSSSVQLKQGPQPVNTTEIVGRFEARKRTAAITLGIGADEVEALPFDLSALENEGIFINIDCRGFGSLARQLEWKTLGVKLPENAAVRVSPPRAGLLPDAYRNKLMRGQAQAHNALNKYGFRFTLCETVWGTSEYKWVPRNAFEHFERAYKNACETLSAAKTEVIEKYDEIVASLIDGFRQLAEDSSNRLQATLGEPFDHLEFVEAVVVQAIGMIPTREMIRDGLIITLKPKVIVLGSELIAERSLSREIGLREARLEAEHNAVRLEIDTKREIERMRIEDVRRDLQHEQDVKERIRTLKIETARREAEEAVSPIKEGFAQISAKICEAAGEMAEKLRDARFVSGSLAKRARQMCEWYALMNFTGDSSLEEVLTKLKAAAGREIKHRSADEMRTAVNEILRATSVQSKKLLDEDRISALEL